MSSYRTEKRPLRYRNDDYILRALYRLLGRHFGQRRSPYSSSYGQRPTRRGLGGMGGYRGSSGFRAPQHSFRYSQGQGSNASFQPKRTYDTGYRDSARPSAHYTQPRTEPDVEELLKRLEQKVDDSLVEKIMERLDAESTAMEKAVKTDTAEPQTSEETIEPVPKLGESAVQEIHRESEVPETENVELEKGKTEPTTAEPESTEGDLYDKLDWGELDWLEEEEHGLTVEVTDIDAEPEIPNLELLENIETDAAKEVAPPEPVDIIVPELEPAKPFEPVLEIIEPLKLVEPGIAELQEEVEDGEVEPV